MKTTAQVGVDNKTDDTLEKNSSYNSNLEGIRGLAALSVSSFHVLGLKNFLDPTYHL
jgi:peptidoglycan/LPS O-acetylase OafA/YrhL